MKTLKVKTIIQLMTLTTALLMSTVASASDQVVCIEQSFSPVYDETMNLILFLAERDEGVKVFQGWMETRKTIEINGKKVSFIKVQFTDRDEEDGEDSEGWISERDIRLKGECKTYIPSFDTSADVPEDDVDVTESAGLADPNCCSFPLASSAKAAYTTGQRRFGAARSKGKRKHAACDLYHRNDEPALAVASGKVIRDLYYFYQGTFAVEVEHPGGFIVRYGELSGKKSIKNKDRHNLSAGDEVGFIKKVNSNCCAPMLHFELYQGNGKGPLSVKSGKGYQRRSDLLNPTKYLQAWESPH